MSASDTSLTVAWDAATASAGIADYDVLIGGVVAGTTAGTAFTLNQLLPGTSYAVTVRARDAAGTVSASSEALTATTTGINNSITLYATLSPGDGDNRGTRGDLVIEPAIRQRPISSPATRGAIDLVPSG
ncbi:fibronectin type III domain-containing protein, partial [Candidatus Gracilibacteria bacterium]|nr:fibronectin type III domain-containing protein [Candidatus Gracilibacteria bacterium]